MVFHRIDVEGMKKCFGFDSILIEVFFCIADSNSRHHQQRRSNESGSSNNATSITAQAQPLIQSSPQLQSVQQPEHEQRRHIKPQTNDRSEPTAARSNAREARPTGTRPKD